MVLKRGPKKSVLAAVIWAVIERVEFVHKWVVSFGPRDLKLIDDFREMAKSQGYRQ